MTTTQIPVNPNNLPPSPTPGNIASLTNSSTLDNLKNSQSPKTFGDQTKVTNQQITKADTDSTKTKLYKEKAALIQEGIKLDLDHQNKLQEIELKHTPTKKIENGQTIEVPAELNDIQYRDAIALENGGTLSTGRIVEGNYPAAQKNLQERKDANQKAIDDYIKDPFKKQKDSNKKRKERLKKSRTKLTEEERKAKKEKRNAILKNASKSLVSILALTLTNKIAEVIAQNGKIGKLVDDTNTIITEANESGDQTKLNNAKIARDNAIRVIQSNEDKINKIRGDISRISTYISIFSTIVSIVSAIPIPTSVPPGVGIPTSLIIRFVKILDKANRILLSLSALIPILLSSLDGAISILQDYKAQLLTINGELEIAAATGINSSLLNNPSFGTVNETYKGFKFALREENNPKFVVRGNKRHYAVAINKQNVEVLKSELSFTLDPNDLIEQLKLAIDQQNLQA